MTAVIQRGQRSLYMCTARSTCVCVCVWPNAHIGNLSTRHWFLALSMTFSFSLHLDPPLNLGKGLNPLRRWKRNTDAVRNILIILSCRLVMCIFFPYIGKRGQYDIILIYFLCWFFRVKGEGLPLLCQLYSDGFVVAENKNTQGLSGNGQRKVSLNCESFLQSRCSHFINCQYYHVTATV